MIQQVDPGKYKTTYAMIAYWNRPWSAEALKFAAWRLHLAMRCGMIILTPDDLAEIGVRFIDNDTGKKP